MQRAAGTSRMVPDPQTAKEGNGHKFSATSRPAVSPFGIPLYGYLYNNKVLLRLQQHLQSVKKLVFDRLAEV